MKKEGYRNLKIFQKSHKLALKVHKMTLDLPNSNSMKKEARYDVLQNQFQVILLKVSHLEDTKMNISVIFLKVMLHLKKL